MRRKPRAKNPDLITGTTLAQIPFDNALWDLRLVIDEIVVRKVGKRRIYESRLVPALFKAFYEYARYKLPSKKFKGA